MRSVLDKHSHFRLYDLLACRRSRLRSSCVCRRSIFRAFFHIVHGGGGAGDCVSRNKRTRLDSWGFFVFG